MIFQENLSSPCINPVVDRWWEYGGHNYHVRGIKRSVEEIKAGVRIFAPLPSLPFLYHIPPPFSSPFPFFLFYLYFPFFLSNFSPFHCFFFAIVSYIFHQP